MMQVVGLTDRQMTGMLVMEGIMQGIGVIVFSMVLWLTLGLVLVEGLTGQLWCYKHHFTITPILICIPFILIIAIVLPLVTCGHMKRQSIVERMQ